MVSPPLLRRRSFLAGMFACGLGSARAEARRYRIALANLDETPGVTREGLGFTGADLRRSFELAARTMPVDMLYFDNAATPPVPSPMPRPRLPPKSTCLSSTTLIPMRMPRLGAALPLPTSRLWHWWTRYPAS